MPVVEKVSGALLIFLGLLLLTGRFTVIAGWLQRYTPAWIYERI
jgi:cytochrome c-type biogenesis protein